MIGEFTVLEAAAASSVDMIADEPYKTAPYPRKITAFGLVGSTAIGDAAVELRIGGNVVGKYFNTTLGAAKVPTVQTDMKHTNIFVPAGAIVQVKIVDVGATNVLAATIRFSPAVMKRAAPRRTRAPRRRGRY